MTDLTIQDLLVKEVEQTDQQAEHLMQQQTKPQHQIEKQVEQVNMVVMMELIREVHLAAVQALVEDEQMHNLNMEALLMVAAAVAVAARSCAL